MSIIIRNTLKEDLNGLKEVLDSSELFPSEYLDEMIANYLTDPASEEIWFTCLQDNVIVGLGYCVPEKLTDRTYNLLAIGVMKDLQGKGIGRRMMTYIEDLLRGLDKRILIVETSSDPNFEQTHLFYEKLNYSKEAVIRDFWQDREDKIVYLKKLTVEK
jgi:ribosomal protein S18 acetylase RimI-like enzyme